MQMYFSDKKAIRCAWPHECFPLPGASCINAEGQKGGKEAEEDEQRG